MFNKRKKIIGRLEYIDIPTLDLKGISAKIDTGAYRGSIHANNVKEIQQDGKKILQFNILDENHPEYKDKVYEISDYSIHHFRGTKVDYHPRYVIPVELVISGEKVLAELSLTDRSDLRHPVLIGRRALKKRFLIDVDKKY
jgi:hypothetical protein